MDVCLVEENSSEVKLKFVSSTDGPPHTHTEMMVMINNTLSRRMFGKPDTGLYTYIYLSHSLSHSSLAENLNL